MTLNTELFYTIEINRYPQVVDRTNKLLKLNLLKSSVIKEELKISHNKSFELFLCLDNNIFYMKE